MSSELNNANNKTFDEVVLEDEVENKIKEVNEINLEESIDKIKEVNELEEPIDVEALSKINTLTQKLKYAEKAFKYANLYHRAKYEELRKKYNQLAEQHNEHNKIIKKNLKDSDSDSSSDFDEDNDQCGIGNTQINDEHMGALEMEP